MTVFDERMMRPYRAADLDRLLRFVGECNRTPGADWPMHPGDVAHFMSNTLRGRDLERYIFLYEEAIGRLRALALFYAGNPYGYDLLVAPDLRGAEVGDFEAATLAWADAQAVAMASTAGSNGLAVEVSKSDTIRERIIARLGYSPTGAPGMLYTARSLQIPIPDKPLPDGFSMRSVAGEQEARLVAAAHNGAFTPKWDEEQYLDVMRTPGFHIERELVVVAPDGRFAAFVIIWLDPISHSGLFEPVGCHYDFQRQGLTSALMYAGMRRMRAAGMDTAIVRYNADNVAGVPLYRSVGFQTRYEIARYRKPLAAPA
jgi:ribosomal protein S18 acetylase RimI-like enzyme